MNNFEIDIIEQLRLMQHFIPFLRKNLQERTQIVTRLITKNESAPFTTLDLESEVFNIQKYDKEKFEEIAVKCAYQEDEAIRKFNIRTLFLIQDWNIIIKGTKAKLYEKIALFDDARHEAHNYRHFF